MLIDWRRHPAQARRTGAMTRLKVPHGIRLGDLTAALDRVSPKDSRDTVRDASGKGNPPAPKDFKQPKFAAPQTREVPSDSYPLSFGMDTRSPRNR